MNITVLRLINPYVNLIRMHKLYIVDMKGIKKGVMVKVCPFSVKQKDIFKKIKERSMPKLVVVGA